MTAEWVLCIRLRMWSVSCEQRMARMVRNG